MLSLFTKKKISDDTLSNIFVNGLLKLVEDGFEEIKVILQNESEFDVKPNVDSFKVDAFLFIVLAGNMNSLPKHFTALEHIKLQDSIQSKISSSLGITKEELKNKIQQMHHLFYKLNHPSKNTKYAMSKAIFHEYQLYNCQDEYFRKMKVPNPVILKKMNEIMDLFIWDWDVVLKKYKIIFE